MPSGRILQRDMQALRATGTDDARAVIGRENVLASCLALSGAFKDFGGRKWTWVGIVRLSANRERTGKTGQIAG